MRENYIYTHTHKTKSRWGQQNPFLSHLFFWEGKTLLGEDEVSWIRAGGGHSPSPNKFATISLNSILKLAHFQVQKPLHLSNSSWGLKNKIGRECPHSWSWIAVYPKKHMILGFNFQPVSAKETVRRLFFQPYLVYHNKHQ